MIMVMVLVMVMSMIMVMVMMMMVLFKIFNNFVQMPERADFILLPG